MHTHPTITNESILSVARLGSLVILTTTSGVKLTGVLTCLFDRGKLAKVRVGRIGFGSAVVALAEIEEIELQGR